MRALLTILATIAVAAAVWLWFSDGMTPVVPPAVVPPAVVATVDVPPAPSPELLALQDVQRSLGQIAARLSAIEQRLAEAPAVAATDVSPTRVDAAPAAYVDANQLRRALDEVEQQRLREQYGPMSDDELLAEVQRLQWKGNDVAGAYAALQQLLARDLTPEQRAKALTELGIVQRQRNDLAGAERTLRGVVDQYGMRAAAGAQAAYQLAWTIGKRDPAAAIGIADALAQQAEDKATRTRARWTAARLAESSGNVTRARADYEALLAEVGDQKELFDVAKDVRYRLEQLGGN